MIEIGNHENPKILIVDDETEVLNSLADLLRKDFHIFATSDIDEAQRLLISHHMFSLVISDQRMPVMTGAEFLARVTKVSPDTARILLTGYADIDAVIEAVNKGQIVQYITKPWDAIKLLEILKPIAERHQLLQENRRLIQQLAQLSEFTRDSAAQIGTLQDMQSALQSDNQTLKASYDQLDQSFRDLKRAEEALRKSEERLDLALKATQDAVWDWDLLTDTLFYSPRWWSMIGYEENELEADANLWRRLMHPDDVERANRIVRAAVAQGNSIEVETRLQHKDGHYVPIHTRGIVLRDNSGKPIRLSGTNMDLTQQKKVEEERKQWEWQRQQLEKAESLNRMAGAVAHHFNNQLGVVIGNLEIALDDLPDNAEPVKNLNEAMKAIRKAADISRRMLTYVGQTPGEREPLDLSEVCFRSLLILRETMPGKIVLETHLPSPGPMISADAIQIQQVLSNLLTNAWEAVGEYGGTIHLSTKTVSPAEIPTTHRFPQNWQSHDTAYACLEVSDAGCGIADSDIEKIFDPFFSTKFTGRGMDLAVVIGIVRAHDGVIAVESELGRGSTFRVFFTVPV